MSGVSANGHQADEEQLRVTVDLSGGLELLFGKVKRHELLLSPAADGDDGRLTLRAIIRYMRDARLKDRPELFTQDGTVRPGILVLVNDCDWELMNGLNCVVHDGDSVTFISTLHGG